MDVLLIGFIIFVVFAALGYPLINAKKYQVVGVLRGDPRLDNLEHTRVQTFDAIRDLQFDHMTGKLSDADYQSLRAQYEYRAAQVLEQLDAIKGHPKQAQVKGSKTCPRCHTIVDPSDKFCVKCGNTLRN